MSTAILSPEGTIAIPSEMRECLQLEPGAELTIDVQGNALVIKRRLVRDLPHWSTMEGMAKGDDSLTDFLEQERQAEIARDENSDKGR